MYCHRCEGLLVPTWLGESYDYGACVPALRCVTCGYIEDADMRKRRLATQRDHDLVGKGGV